ncbi:RHS repeat domain-containing protein [Psychrobacter pygoscelis]|uniref:RHS repeat domain-containing protein n=1 Tax=Psychrobacter pygoscelis TaxID=2488563 RepID=UPI00103DE969|nr:RHS repeat-associated core domain-containing protein [Psychrobacter pygoscelis]
MFNIYNPIGQRIQKNSGNSVSAKTYFSYDEQGLLIGEYGVNGEAIREYVYLGGQPIAMLSSEQPDEVLQIHSDHLGTPRAVSNANNEILWRMEGDQFGDVQPSVEQVKLPLRHAGQYADDETGLFYNYYRFYDPKTGRNVTSDPIGLDGGMNTYGYVGGSPLSAIDPYGLSKQFGLGLSGLMGFSPVGAGGGVSISISIPDNWQNIKCYQLTAGTNANVLLGLGQYVGYGINLIYSENKGPLVPGFNASVHRYAEGAVGVGPISLGIGMQGKENLASANFFSKVLSPQSIKKDPISSVSLAPPLKVGQGMGYFGGLGLTANLSGTTPVFDDKCGCL